ncbi:MAG: apolipoprotein N-acyltransferase [Candidatus Omnitrophota bacterium]
MQRRSLLFSVLGGIFTGISFDVPAASSVIWFSFVPFLYILYKDKSKESVRCGFCFGIAYFSTALLWLTHVTILGLIVLVMYLALYPVLFVLSAKIFINKPFRFLTLPSIWVLLEFLQENIWCGFGWANAGYSQYKNTYLIQAADLGGVKLISFLIIMVNVLWVEILCKKKFLRIKIATVTCAIVLVLSYSAYRLHALKPENFVPITLVQPNIAQELKWQEFSSGFIAEKLRTLGKQAGSDSLVIFPEASWPTVLGDENFSVLKDFMKDLRRDALIGAVKQEGNSFYNTALLFDKEGNQVSIYRKIKLVPFGEYVPLRRYISFISVINAIGDMSRGAEYKTFSYQDKKFSVLICFEDVFPLFVSRFARNRDFLVSITNDAWFGGNPEASQHLALMVFRAIENRISIARCANTGISGWVSFKGEINQFRDKGREILFDGVAYLKLPLNSKRSLYNTWREAFVCVCGLLLLASFLCGLRTYPR